MRCMRPCSLPQGLCAKSEGKVADRAPTLNSCSCAAMMRSLVAISCLTSSAGATSHGREAVAAAAGKSRGGDTAGRAAAVRTAARDEEA